MSQNLPTPHGMPAAEVAIDLALVCRLIAQQLPKLAHLPVRYLATGWDNEVYRLGEDLLIRLPRRKLAEELGGREREWLPTLSTATGLDVGAPVFSGQPTAEYPFTFSVCSYVSGVSAATLKRAERDEYAVDFTRYLQRLHLPAPADAPRSDFRGLALVELETRTRAQILQLPRSIQAIALRIWDEATSAEAYAGAPRWLHGDPHPHNTIAASESGTHALAGLVDFGDLCAGDPASDLGMFWLHFTPQTRDLALGEYGVQAGDPMWRRARGWALRYTMIICGLDACDPLGAIGRETLELIFE
ncbi:MAG TPA: phosphotransferase [Micrococcaceae bacterium]|nr:phosphotransferase [Micrococcaceae bacterium]